MVKDGHELRCRVHRVNATTPRGSSPVRGDAHKILIHVLLDFVHAYVFFTSLRACVLESFTLSTIHFTFFCCRPFFAKKGTCNVNISPPTHFFFTTRSKCHEICPLLHFFSKMSPGDINSGTHCKFTQVPGEATVRNISRKCWHKMALSLVIIVRFLKFCLRILLKRKFLAKPRYATFPKSTLKIAHFYSQTMSGEVAILRRRRTVRYFFSFAMMHASFSFERFPSECEHFCMGN